MMSALAPAGNGCNLAMSALVVSRFQRLAAETASPRANVRYPYMVINAESNTYRTPQADIDLNPNRIQPSTLLGSSCFVRLASNCIHADLSRIIPRPPV
jgi:hypothetical protein